MDETQVNLGPSNDHQRIVAIREIAFGLMCSALEGGFDFYSLSNGWEGGAESALIAAETIVNYGGQK